uniref:Vacuolar protein sorting-associated protein 54 C-terminal domain-containing protein n=1 Tax=Globodera rostochiensis TaxID=31243 RepID=A0A914HHS6_GLORO
MSDNKSDEEQQQQMERIFICADIWYEVFNFLSPFDLGLKLALINDRFDALVDVHFKSREWSLDWMIIRRANDGNGAQIVNARSREGLRIPQGPLPDNVIGFKHIEISYLDQNVIKFLEEICRPNFGTTVFIESFYDHSWEIIRQKIWPLVNDNICGFLRLSPSVFDRLRQFSPTILRDCAKLRSIHSLQLFPEFPASDDTDATSAQALTEWLITPRGDDLPKMLYCEFFSARMDELKGSFVNASERANFIIKFLENDDFEPFELKNNWTGERLTFRQIDEDKWLLVRCPIEREEDKWANWEKEAIEWKRRRHWNFIAITFQDNDIGDGTATLLLRILAQYSDLLVLFAHCAMELTMDVVQMLKAFNSRTCQLILGAGARQLVGLKMISVKHLTLALRSLQFIAQFIPTLRQSFSNELPTDRHTLLRHFDQTQRDFEDHAREIRSKMLGLMDRELIGALEEWRLEGKTPTASFQQIVMQIGKFYSSYSAIMPPELTTEILLQIHMNFKLYLRQHLNSRGISPHDSIAYGMAGQDFAYYMENVRALPDCKSFPVDTIGDFRFTPCADMPNCRLDAHGAFNRHSCKRGPTEY